MKSLSTNQPHAIVMVGLPGSGKTFFAEKFAETFNAPHISHDTLQELTSLSEDVVAKVAAHHIAQLLKTKSSIIIEGGASSRIERTELSRRLRQAGYRPLLVWVQTDTETARFRSLRANGRTEEEFESRARRFSQPHESEQAVVISGKHTYPSQARIVLKRLSGQRTAEASTPKVPARPTRSHIDIRRGN